MLHRRVGVHDEGYVVDGDAARGDVRGHQGADAARVESVQVAGAGVLAEVAVQVDGGHAQADQLLGELLRAVLRAREHDDVARRCRELGQHLCAVIAGDAQHVVRHRADGGVRRVGLVGDGVGQELTHQRRDARVEGGGEQHPLAALGRRLKDAAHAGEESHVGHVVGLVDDGDLDGAEVDEPLFHEVQQATRARDEDVDAAGKGLCLRVLPHAAEDDGGGEARGALEGDEGLVDLGGQLAGRGEHESARPLRLAARGALAQSCDERQEEGVGLARAGAPAAEDVASGHGVGQRRGLDGGGGGDAPLLKRGDEGRGHAEAGEIVGQK